MSIRVGIVGCGDVANHIYLPGLKQVKAEGVVELVAVCDAVESRVEHAAKMYDVPRQYLSYEDLLKDEDVDLIVSSVPVPHHAQVVTEALEAGKHVYTEKPLATTIEDADRIIATAKKADRLVGCAPVLMVHPETQYLQHLLNTNAVGKVCFVRARASNPGPAWCEDYLTDPTWFYKPGGGGPLFDLAVYPLTVLTGLLGPARNVVAMSGISVPERVIRAGAMKGQTIDVEVDDNTQLMLDFGEATFATVDATFCALSARGPRMEIYGSGGVINLYSKPDEPAMEIYRDDPESNLRGWLVPQPPYRGSLKPADPRPGDEQRPWTFADGIVHMAQAIEQGSELLISAAHARHVLEIMLKALESARLGRTLPLETRF